MRIGLVGSPDSWYFADMKRAAGPRHEIIPLAYAEIEAAVPAHGSLAAAPSRWGECDALLLRSMPPGSLEQVVFRMDALAQREAAGVCVINPPRAMETAIDKFLTSARLAAAGLPTPPTHVAQAWPAALEAFHRLGGDVVVKPLFGGEGRGITRISDEELAHRAFKLLQQMGAVIYQQQFIEHEGCDVRLLVLGEKIWGMRRCNAHDWRTNVSRGAQAQPLAPTAELAALAGAAADAVGAVFAGVDVLTGRDGRQYVLEVNAAPGWKALSQTLDVDIAAELLAYVESRRRPKA